MKTLTLILAVTVGTLMSNYVLADEGDSTHVITKIIKIVDNGKTIVDTTVVYSTDDFAPFFIDDITRPNVRMIKHRKAMSPKGQNMTWTNNNNEEYEVTIESDGDSSNVIVMRQPGNKVKGYHFNGDRMKERRMMLFNNEDFEELPNRETLLKHRDRNLIDLNDPNIIRFEREKTKDGNEKITIIRKKAEGQE